MKYVLIMLMFLIVAGCQGDMIETENLEETSSNDSDSDSDPEDISSENGVLKNEPDISEIKSQNWELEVVADQLNIPWDININDKFVVLTEREGTIVVIEEGTMTRYPIHTSDPIAHQGEGGLLGMELKGDFNESGQAFLYYTYSSEIGLANKVVEVLFDGERWEETDILIEDIPGDRIHNGGRIAIGPDGYLYVTTGDANDPELSQEKDNLAGSILRLDIHGNVPEDNPFQDSYLFSYGHRNPQGLAWDSNGKLFSSEHGPTAHDEINEIVSGKNYGWPIIKGDEEQEGMELPLIHSGNDTWAPSGMTFWHDYLVVAGLRGQSLYGYDMESESMEMIFSTEGRLRDVVQYDGDLYVITNNTDGRGTPSSGDDRLLRLTYLPENN
ncbi:PQQ-dependent sugar dehydrogenase [Evansella tamaricis]|uniref:Sorbosone dehydrogenase family protein n=1 Tax=Evansella tamaricis TaxID=2069301 RepID=A0ABS6JJE7_9BACI|nr:sorbosone dehydrogenase family protein [Evansella tamaricis]MBU9713785.1 sorbosone dehydrogenase family protein [Evansella tamaricis]